MINMLKNKQKTFNDLSLKTNYNRDTLNKAKNLKIQDKAEKDEYNNIMYYPSSTKEWLVVYIVTTKHMKNH